GLEDVDYLTNAEALSLQKIPESLIVIGGRALGLEFAQIYSHLGTRVVVLQRSPRIIPDHEPEISEALRLSLVEEGIEIHTRVQVKRISRNARGKIVEAAVDGKPMAFDGKHLLMATGRRPNTSGLGLENLGINFNGGASIQVNEHMQTSADHVWAAGDVIGKPMLETTAAREGYVAASNALEGSKLTIDYDSVPHAIFTSPQVASVGLNEEELSKRIEACACRTVPMSRVPKARAVKDTRGIIKMVIDPRTAVVAGVHIVSPHAAEIIHEATLAVKHRLTIDDIIDTVHVFPTFSEAIKIAATAFRRDITKMSCCIQ
ncbi:MAG: FAD-dependent oxidoreductase, partial [Candidatus Geothermarchaeales archaeon]